MRALFDKEFVCRGGATPACGEPDTRCSLAHGATAGRPPRLGSRFTRFFCTKLNNYYYDILSFRHPLRLLSIKCGRPYSHKSSGRSKHSSS